MVENSDDEEVEEIEEKLNEGFVMIQENEKDGKYFGGKRYYLKFLFEGKFLGFFSSKDIKNIPVFYFKTKYIRSIEDFFDNKPNLVLLEYEDETEKSIVFVINDMKEKEKWVDDVTVMKDKYEDMEDNEEEDFGLSELETKYLLTEDFENDILESKLKNYDYSKHFLYDYFNLLDDIYDYDPELKKFKVSDASRYLFYSSLKFIKTKKKYANNEKVSINEAEIKKSLSYFTVIALSKQIPLKTDEVNLALCEKVTKSKKIAKWMSFNYFYIFKSARVKGNKKSLDNIKPYEFLMDMTEWQDITFLNSNKMAVQISVSKIAYVFVFSNIIECRRFYYFAKKSQENLREYYKMKKYSIKVNVDFCKSYESLVELETIFKIIVQNIFDRSGITDKKKVLRNFSLTLNSFFIGFNCKTTFEPRYLAIFLKVYENFFFEKILGNLVKKLVKKKKRKEDEEPQEDDIKVEFKLQTPEKILALINDIKFHEEILRKWNIIDLRILGAEKVLEEIYTKLHFNQFGIKIIHHMKKINTGSNFYYKEKKQVSTVIINLFDEIKAMVLEMKTNRKDKDYKLNVIKILRRAINLVFCNLKFISEDPNVKIELKYYPCFLNSLLEINQRLMKLIKQISQKLGISSRYLKMFFSRKNFKKQIEIIKNSIIKSYQLVLTKDIDKYFKELNSLEYFNLREFFDDYLKAKFEISNEFLPEINNVPEFAAVYSSLGNLLEYVATKYKDTPDDFELVVFKKKLNEFQGKISSLRLNDQLTKIGITKIIRSIESFFLLDKKLFINSYNISFVLAFKNNYHVLSDIITLKDFENESVRLSVLEFIKKSNKNFRIYHRLKDNANKLYRDIRAMVLCLKFIKILKSKYEIKKEKMENSESEEESEEEEDLPPEVPKKIITLRYFVYKKSSKQNYGYIKAKIKKLQFDPAFVETTKGNIYIKHPKKHELIYKVLMLSKVTFLEKFEQIFLTIYYRHNMMLILEFPTESENNSYLKTLTKLVTYYRTKKIDLPMIQVSDFISSKKALKPLFLYNIKLKYDFVYSHLFSDTKLFYFKNTGVFRFRGIMNVSLYDYIENLRQIAFENGEDFDENNLRYNDDKAEFNYSNVEIKKDKKEVKRRKSGDFLKKYDYRKLAGEIKRAKEKIGG